MGSHTGREKRQDVPETKRKKWRLAALIVLVVLMVGGAAGFRVALSVLKDKVVEALGEGSEIREIRAGISGVVVDGLRIRGAGNWPAEDTLRADQVIIVPSLWSLFSRQYRIHSITVNNPYICVFRDRNGKVKVVPSLMHKDNDKKQDPSDTTPPPQVSIGQIVLKDGSAEFYDASMGQRPTKITLTRIQADIEDIVAPALNAKSSFDMSALMKGPQDEGRITIKGWADLSTRDSSISLKLASVDMVPFQAYLLKAGDVRVNKGMLDLDLKSEVRDKRLKAPGRITISDLTLAPSKGFMGTFMGVPRDAVLSFLKDKDNRITLDFVLQGDLNNPKFTLHEAMSQRMAVSMAGLLKVGIGGVAKTAGELGAKGVDAAGEVMEGVEDTLKGILGGQQKK